MTYTAAVILGKRYERRDCIQQLLLHSELGCSNLCVKHFSSCHVVNWVPQTTQQRAGGHSGRDCKDQVLGQQMRTLAILPLLRQYVSQSQASKPEVIRAARCSTDG